MTGFLGSAHCLGMCAGISGMIAVNAGVTALTTQLPLAIAYNAVIMSEPTPDDAISHVMLRWLSSKLVVGWAVGAVVGHWVWPWDYPGEDWKRQAQWLLLALTAGILAYDVTATVEAFHPLWSFVPGFIAGHLLWPQLPKHRR